jgi:predicted transport protein
MTESDDEDEDDCIVILPGDDVSLNDEYEDDNDEQGHEKQTRMWGVYGLNCVQIIIVDKQMLHGLLNVCQ